MVWKGWRGVKGSPVSYPAVPVTKTRLISQWLQYGLSEGCQRRRLSGSTFPHLQHRLESVLGLWQSHKKLDQRTGLVENSPHFPLFFQVSFQTDHTAAQSWGLAHKGKENLWLRAGGISSLHSTLMLRLAKSGSGGASWPHQPRKGGLQSFLMPPGYSTVIEHLQKCMVNTPFAQAHSLNCCLAFCFQN